MAKAYRSMMLDAEVHQALMEFREQASQRHLYTGGQFGLSHMIAVLLWHFKTTPPDPEEFRKKVQDAPRRGRPRTKVRPPPLP